MSVIINQINVCPNHDARSIEENGKTYYVCNVCGRKSFRVVRSHGLMWCDKHYKQFKRHGHVLDNNPRTPYDRNEIEIDGDVARMSLYDVHGDVVARTLIDAEDVAKVRYTKWTLARNGYVMNKSKRAKSAIHLSRAILNANEYIDHINHDALDNRKCNLRIVTKSQNAMNRNAKGVSVDKDGLHYARIKKNGKMLNLGRYAVPDEALWARWYAETVVFDDYRYDKPEPDVPAHRKAAIKAYVDRKVQRL